MRTAGHLFAILLVLSGTGIADQITLKNGDRITGDITNSDAKTIAVKTEAMGEVRINRTSIATLSSAEPLTVTLKDGTKAEGTIASEGGSIRVTKSDATIVTASEGDVQSIRNTAAQQAWEREQMRLTAPPLLDFWSGSISLNLANASGNARTTTFGVGASAQRVTGFDKIVLTFAELYSRQSTAAPIGATANRVSGGIRYDRNFTKRLFGFALNSYEFDRFQDLDLRSVFGGGLGFHVYKSANSFWDVNSGAVWNREAFSDGLTRNSAEVVVSEESSNQVNTILRFFQHLSAFPNVSNAGQYRLNFDGGASLKLTRRLSWEVTVSDRYLSNPPLNKKKNDVILTTGIAFNFEQK